MTTSRHSNVLDAFHDRCVKTPDAPVFTFVDDEGRDGPRLTYAGLRATADAIAGFLTRKCGLARGDRALLCYTPSLEFVAALVGCLRAGIIAVPVCPPDPRRLHHDLQRFSAMAEACGAKAILTNEEYARMRLLARVRDVFRRGKPAWPDLPWHTTDGVKPGAFAPPPYVSPRGGDTAILQYTSGSTSRPKGVVITHENLRHQLGMNAGEVGCGAETRAVLWVPHYHDFGLITGILSALHGNGHLYLMSPLSFIRRPAVWFEVMSRVRATHTAAPNFAYELAVRKTSAAERRRWDLRPLQVVMSAAEPIRHSTVKAFLDAFAESGLRPEAFCPAYGLAEHTVGVSVQGRKVLRVARAALERNGVIEVATAMDDSPAEVATLMGCGRPAEGVRVRVVDPETCLPLADGRIGEIWVDSPSKAAGYYGLPEETRRTFQAKLANSDDATEYLRTGDLGASFQGEIFITGRRKDLIIVRGRNLYPQDIEESVRDCHRAIRPGGVAVFSVEVAEQAAERIVVMAELREDAVSDEAARAVVKAIHDVVSEEHGEACHAIVLARPGAIPKTTSGKLQRSACREAFTRGELLRASTTIHVARFADEAPRSEPPRAEPQGDPRLAVDDDFKAMLDDLGALFGRMSKARAGRVFHKEATTLRGELRVIADSSVPRTRFFAQGRRYPVLVRHANGTQDDDAAPDNRGATVRLLDPNGSGDPTEVALDLLLTTGQRFLSRSAADFQRWVKGSAADREALVRARPEIGEAAWEMFRLPDSYAEVHYHSKTANHFDGEDGRRHFARFRLVPADGRADGGFVASKGAPLPPDRAERDPADRRSRTFLHEDLRARMERGGIDYRLEVQLRPATDATRDEALDCTRLWPEGAFPWRPLATLHLDSIADAAAIEPISFNPWNAPPELALPLARSTTESASLAHLRSLVYDRSAEARRSAPASQSIATKPRARRVCVIGAGAAGLSAAWELDRLGHQVTVLERASTVSGKCASIDIDGRAYDLGGHVCSDRYTALREMVTALGVATEPATPTRLFDLERRAVEPEPDSPALRENFLRYQGLRDTAFRGILAPGLHGAAATLWQPIRSWFAFHDLAALGEAIAVTYTSCGYGFPDDSSIAAAYLLKSAELAGMLSPPTQPGASRYWTITGGFGALWDRVAKSLPDVRCGVAPEAIERRDGRVYIRTNQGVLECDVLVIASPLDEATRFLDSTPEERDLFGRIRTLDYFTVVASASGLPEKGFYLVKQHCASSSARGHVVAYHHRYEGSDVHLFYAYGDGATSERDIEARLADDVRRMGGTLGKIHLTRRWKYFPHVAPEDLRAGYFDRVERLQGQSATYYVGGLLGFELVEGCVSHARDLMQRHFGEERSIAPAPAASAAPRAVAPQIRAAQAEGLAHEARVELLLGYLRALMEEALPQGGARLDPHEDITRTGLDSIKSIELLQRITADTGLSLAPVVFLEHPTLHALATHLAHRLGPAGQRASMVVAAAAPRASTSENRWFFRPEPADRPRLRLFCLPHAGGHAQRYQSWPRGLPPGVEVCAIQVPGRGARDDEPWFSDMTELVSAITDAMAPLLDVPFAIFGHSAGALLAFEVTRKLRAAGRRLPEKLLISSFEAPLMAAFGMSPWARADLRLAAEYHYTREAPLDLPITLLQCDEDLIAPAGSLGGWRDETARDFTMTHLSGLVRYDTSKPRFLAALGEALRAHWPRSPRAIDSMPGMPQESRWFIRPRPLDRPELRLFCFHDDAGTADMFDSSFDAVPPGVEVCPIQLPGRGSRIDEPMATTHAELLEGLEAAIAPWIDDVPFAVFGHSGGSIVAFELIRQLRRKGRPLPTHFIVSNAPSPHYVATVQIPSMKPELMLALSWNYQHDEPLPVPIAVFGGERDPVVGQPLLEAWSGHTSREFSLKMLPGNHFHLQTSEALFLEALSAALPVRRVDTESRLAALAARVGRASVASSGGLDLYELCWAARVTTGVKPAAPLFPEIVERLIALQSEDGGLGGREHPQVSLVVALAFANTLALYDERAGWRYEAAIRRAVRHAITQIERLREPLYKGDELPHGRHHQFDVAWGKWLLPAREGERLLAMGRRYLDDDEARALAALVGPPRKSPEASSYEAAFATDALALQLAEHFPDEAIRTAAARAHVERAAGLPGFSVAFAARYVEATRDERVLRKLREVLDRPDGWLWHGGRRNEVIFNLRFLLEGGVDVARHFPEEIAALSRMITRDGVTFEAQGALFDCDLSAMAQSLCHRLKLPTPMPTRRLEAFWSEERQSYQSFDGNFVYTASAALHVLEAWLTAPDASHEAQRAIWRRTVRLLEERPWTELYHMSPFYLWEQIVTVTGEHAHRFPEDPTRAHFEALDRILENQASSGGFKSPFTAEPNREETGLALLGLKAALVNGTAGARRSEITRAVRGAEAFLAEQGAPWEGGYLPSLWAAKVFVAPLNVIEAIVIAALAKP